MFEKIYAWLLRFYPRRFRESYGSEAMQLFRDRVRDEKGFFLTLRLWLDLFADLAVSLPRQYLRTQPALAAGTIEQHVPGAPAFFVLADKSPRPGALLMGGLISFAALALFSALLTQVKAYKGRASSAYQQRQSNPSSSRQQSPRPLPRDAAAAADRSAASLAALDPRERRLVVHAAAANVQEHYAYPDLGQKMADALLEHERGGDDDSATDGASFAALLTRQMRAISPDRHLSVDYFDSPLPEYPQGQTPETFARYRDAMRQQNCTFEKVQVLAHNIGYLKLNSFPDLSVCQSTVVAAMASLNHSDALIFDLRDNGGGDPATVAFVAAYLFDYPEYWYNPRENTTVESWTHSPIPGNLLADKPVYLLTSRRTYSGAEQFSYDLKMLKRATLVGETTGGGAHSGVFYRLDEHFGMGIPEAKAINPFSKTDWAEVGVEPDVKVKAADALDTAAKLAEGRPRKN